MASYYNEFNPYMAQWLRNLIKAGRIAPGDVDERSITDVSPDDLRGYRQVHLFAGLGGWSLALRSAGVPDDEDVWSASFPCQPFSAAGAGRGFADERHLYPHGYWLISQCRPRRLVGEQVASKDAEPWLDVVQASLERLGYAFGAVAFPSAGVGAPHIRDRTYWVADASGSEWFGRSDDGALLGNGPARGRHQVAGHTERSGDAGWLANAGGERFERGERVPARGLDDRAHAGRIESDDGSVGVLQAGLSPAGQPGPTNGYWADADWLGCRDGKWRPVEPGTFPLAHGLPVSLGRLSAGERRLAEVAGLDAASLKRAKAYRTGVLSGAGNAINIEAARIFIECAFGSVRPAVDDLSDLI